MFSKSDTRPHSSLAMANPAAASQHQARGRDGAAGCAPTGPMRSDEPRHNLNWIQLDPIQINCVVKVP